MCVMLIIYDYRLGSVIESVYEKYKMQEYTAGELVDMTHKDQMPDQKVYHIW